MLKRLLILGMLVWSVAALEQLLAREAASPAMDEDRKHQLARLAELTFLVEPVSILSQPATHYLEIWRRYVPLWDILRSLSCMTTEQSWAALMQIGSEPAAGGKFEEEFAVAVATATSHRVADFCQLVADRSLFGWCRNAWTASRVAEIVAPVFMKNEASLERVADACSLAATPLADAFFGALFDEARRTDRLRIEAGLRALGEG